MVQTPAFDPRVFRDTLGHYASGITIISGIDEDDPIGFACQSFYPVSTEPLPDSFRSRPTPHGADEASTPDT
ncbi:Flavin-dependent monooxygenase, reductase subunit HsaB [Arthrobacter sp. Bi83]|uniref:hypothetical protein n=1 Tax=Arthrobacter sp. Bi83 TaxID=2822353 RepID=UPI001DB134BE|nr:hypothetical protein [Arthrobacter sp. Bi83]CAH0176747.1 Flavin-dependent monooxygenase, reductase subunit HsaB [Arthrobacter sp. Bi83]